MDNPNIPQVNETLVVSGYYPNGKAFSYSWTLKTELKGETTDHMTYDEARQRLYNQALEGIEQNQA